MTLKMKVKNIDCLAEIGLSKICVSTFPHAKLQI